jgi:coiled-coil and C2 domain-containing protein 1
MSRARAQLRLCSKLEEALKLHKKGRPIQPETLPAPRGFDALPALQVPASGNSQLSAPSKQRSASPSPARIVEISPQEKAEMLRAKALEYKKAALAAKKKGDLAAASKYLQAAKVLISTFKTNSNYRK